MTVQLNGRAFKFDAGYGEIAVVDNEVDGPPVLFIHGNSGCKEVFHHQFSSALAGSYRFIAFDLPGCGASDDAAVPQDIYRMEPMAKITRRLLKTLGATDAVLVGWSLGGHLAIELAQEDPGHKGVVMSGTPPSGPAREEALQAFNLTEAMLLTGKVEFTKEDVDLYGNAIFGDTFTQDKGFSEAVARADGQMREISGIDWGTNEQAGHHQLSVIANLNIPMAVLDGTGDPFINHDWMEKLVWKNLWRGKYHIIENTGHAPFLQNPEAYNALLTEYLNDVFSS